ncbi:uncharacterized protein LOC105015147 isoform X1 [Esox lucius]|uniref:Fibronectin type-III domain-containing protein n=1 Tax=Esox lucius TaxID=8010 RepID=A0A3P8ZQA7_ESOLU|nr:uncharacterized protein LOC105015147 isoform X1 [Esox lucius]
MHCQRRTLTNLIFGVLFVNVIKLSFPLQVSSVVCNCSSITSCYGHCVASQEKGELDCFGKRINPSIKWKCVWTNGKLTVNKMYRYTLVIEQKKYCQIYPNISGTSMDLRIVNERYNITARLFDESYPHSCKETVFRGFPPELVRCGPPLSVKFNRHSRQLDVLPSWGMEKRYIQSYTVRYKELKGPSWAEPTVYSQDINKLTVRNLSSSMTYEVQLRVLENQRCTQVPWSKSFLVQPELTDVPVINMVKDIPKRKGKRLVTIKWKFAASELSEGYRVTVKKSGGETTETFNTSHPLLTLILSHSAYQFEIIAISKVGTSPAAQRTIPPFYDKGLYGKLKVTFNGNTSFNVSWVDDLIKTYSCFAVEWWGNKEKAAHKSFYEDEKKYKVILLDVPLQQYTRYTFTLHTRPYKDVCNLKSINKSESTYGSIQAYFKEGIPISAPGNISSNVTQSSMVLEWIAVPEEDTRGFLLGYILYYRENPQDGTETETNITIDAGSTSYELVDLKSSTVYKVQLSAFTGAGMGVRSSAAYFETKPKAYFTANGVIAGVVAGVPILLLLVHLSSMLFKRAKKLLWPSIPNPDNSNAIQKLDGVCELKLLDPNNSQTLEEEEGGSKSLCIIDRNEEISSISNIYSNSDICLQLNTDQMGAQGPSTSTTDSPKPSSVDLQTDTATACKAAGPTSDMDARTSTDMTQTAMAPNSTVAHKCPPLAFLSDYTTMELFQQTMPQGISATCSSLTQGPSSQSTDTDSTLTPLELHYICPSLSQTAIQPSHGSASETQNTEECYTVL